MGNNKYSTYEIRVSAIKAFLRGQPLTSIAKFYNVHRATIYRWKVKYTQNENFNCLLRKPGSGRPEKLTPNKLKRLRRIVLKPASRFNYETDFWTCRRLIQVLRKKLHLTISQPTMWRVLRRLNLVYKKPECRYYQADENLRRRWLNYELPKILKIAKKYRAILYFEDETTISLAPVLAKTWAPRGEIPIQKATGLRASLAAMSAISKSGKLLFTLHDKRIASKEVICFLRQMLKHHPRRHLVVVMDQAPPHISKKTKTFISEQRRLHVFYLPPYSPDFNPSEEVWNHLKNGELKGHQAQTKGEIKMLAREKLNYMASNPKLLKGIFFRSYVANFMN